MPDIRTVMTADKDGKELVIFAKATAQRLVDDRLTRTQIRNIFTEVRRIEDLWRPDEANTVAMRRLNMLRPKLEYAKARQREVTNLSKVLDDAIQEVNVEDDKLRTQRFQRFMELFEAILAYHRALGGGN